MPQAEPMSAKELIDKIYRVPSLPFTQGMPNEKKAVAIIKRRDTQRDRDILTKAAERAVEWLSAGFVDEWLSHDAKESLYKAILAPLEKEEENEDHRG